MSDFLERLYQSSHLFGGNARFIEALYERYLSDPDDVPEQWRELFDQLQTPGQRDVAHSPIVETFRRLAASNGGGGAATAGGRSAEFAEKQAGVLRLINAFRVRGHLHADLDPLALTRNPSIGELEPDYHHLYESDMDTVFNTGSLVGPGEMKLRDIVSLLRETYCGRIGWEYMHIADAEQRRWLQEWIEGSRGKLALTSEQRRGILERLTAAEGLEKYLHTRYVGQKRFSLEGCETLIPLLHELIQRVGAQGVRELVLGMAHRGRLNVLINILGKSPAELFEEFEGKPNQDDLAAMGDVKYHLGYSSDVTTEGGALHLALAFNPSHLESVDPVVAGSVRARQTRRGDIERSQVVPVVIHGDAAFAGQGVVMELFNMSQARGFSVGGTVHVIVNNQIGFTTSHPMDARSTMYCTEVAKMVQAPILHVNADDPEAVLLCTQVATDFRLRFKKDVVIDLVCYRRHGHNEADEPALTQPTMYEVIRQHTPVRERYLEQLIAEGVADKDGAQKLVDDYRAKLDAGEPVAELLAEQPARETTVDWTPYLDTAWDSPADTTVSEERLVELAERITALPEDMTLHKRAQRVVDERRQMASGQMRLDWGFAEHIAYASLLDDGYQVRVVGQDSRRGTFAHRHAVLHDQDGGRAYTPLRDGLDSGEAFTIIDSLLSEEAVVGFEYGYATADPSALVVWEAQFGDFANGAQVVIDQFISSGEAKWGRLCGLVLFLPHGYEGQGPEHSSARLERFMQLCAQFNMQVCVPTTPGQMFHMLRRQMVRPYRKPLVVMTPKSLLRHKASTSTLEDLSGGHFHVVIPEQRDLEPGAVERVVLCAGKVYYDLAAEREKRELDNIAIVRVEQLYPFPREWVIDELKRYPKAKEVVWCQEEPMNQGAWYQIKHHFQYCIDKKHALLYAGRERSPSPAVGHYSVHLEQQRALVDEALTPGKGTALEVE